MFSVPEGKMIELIDGVCMKTTERLDKEEEYSRGLFCYFGYSMNAANEVILFN